MISFLRRKTFKRISEAEVFSVGVSHWLLHSKIDCIMFTDQILLRARKKQWLVSKFDMYRFDWVLAQFTGTEAKHEIGKHHKKEAASREIPDSVHVTDHLRWW